MNRIKRSDNREVESDDELDLIANVPFTELTKILFRSTELAAATLFSFSTKNRLAYLRVCV